VRGQMLLKVSFLEALGLSPISQDEDNRENSPDNRIAAKVYSRMVVIEKALPSGGSDVWVFDVDELDGIHAIELDILEAPAAGVQTSASTCTYRVFQWQNRRVSLLDDTRLFDSLRTYAL